MSDFLKFLALTLFVGLIGFISGGLTVLFGTDYGYCSHAEQEARRQDVSFERNGDILTINPSVERRCQR